MAYELYGVLSGAINLTTGEKVTPVYGGGSESFLKFVVTPIYNVVYEEAAKNKNGTADHSKWRNYDDLNEYFWSPNCFQLGWPIRLDHDFFCVQPSSDRNAMQSKLSIKKLVPFRQCGQQQRSLKASDFSNTVIDMDIETLGCEDELRPHLVHQQVSVDEDQGQRWLGKTNFVEIRSFWQIFRSFDRMWSFFILALQAMIIMAWHGLGSPLDMFNANIFEDIMSIFITSAVLNLIHDLTLYWQLGNTVLRRIQLDWRK
ncbi:hypothetical protein GIB67_000673 [Kingdonia uniflora]|uniref:1,3-beta-glucan synthase component FKS1-like domain-containing protein n=1 Tax=Kingdonia uniflora TaxID=39325 RepID=A0A7J7NCV7_9MAGN|nr:hypothetical protein GIB67_000673 [Kingdonia uniflora]